MSVSGSSFASSSRRSDRSYAKREILSYSVATWEKLKVLERVIRETEDKVSKQKELLEPGGQLHSALEVYNLAAQCENIRRLNALKSRRLDQIKRMCAKKRLAMTQLGEERVQKDEIMNLWSCRSQGMADRIREFEEEFEKRRRHLNVYSHLVCARRKLLIADLFAVFELKVGVHRAPPVAGKPECPCTSMDTIRGIHLPSLLALVGHSDVTLSAGLGMVVHLLDCISHILDYSFRYPLQPGASTSHIRVPKEDKSLALYGTRWKADRDRLDHAVTMISRNIAQLRSDSGLMSPGLEKTIQSLLEWFQAVQNGVSTLSFNRPRRNICSPSSLVEKEGEDEPELTVVIPTQHVFTKCPSSLTSEAEDMTDCDRTMTDSSLGSNELDTSAISCLHEEFKHELDDGTTKNGQLSTL